MNDRKKQRLFMLDHNANCIPGIPECNGEHPFVSIFFFSSLCIMYLLKASGSDPPVQVVLSLGSS